MSHSPKRVVISGASSGIGAATAIAFAERGGRVVLAARDADALENIVAQCRAAGGEALGVPTDVTDAAAVQALAARAQDWLGEIDLWFANVGLGAIGRFHEVPIEAHDQVIATNLVGHVHEAHAAVPIFIAQERGIFVNMISVGGFLAAPWAAAYAASKFGLRGFSQALRAELTAYPHIHVCDLYPTVVDTPAIAHAGNYVGARVSAPPGSLDPRTVAAAVVRLADRPRATTAVGMPALAMKLGQFLTPNLSARMMNGFFSVWARRGTRVPETSGNLFAPPADDGRVDGGFRDHSSGKTAMLALGGVAALGLAVLVARRRPAV